MAGLKSLAQELQSKGRNGDTILAHINPQEADMLKAMGGSGTINPATGLPEFFWKKVTRAVAAPFRAVNEVVKAIPGIGPAIDRGLVGLDKTVGSAIPGGWNTLAQTALAFTPLSLPAKVGLAALGGSGALGPKGKFNFQRALMSGALAYGANQLAQGLETAGGGTPNSMISGADVAAANLADDPIAALNASQGFTGVGGEGGAQLLNTVPESGISQFATKTMNNLSAAGEGIKNLTGFGTGATEAAAKFTGPVTTGGMTALGMGTMGLMSLDEQEKLLNQQYQQGQVNDDEYNRQAALIADGRRRAEEAIKAHPYQFARGGQIDDEIGGDYSAQGMNQGNLQKGLFGMGYAMGGQPRFLSGGGDGMSDSIQATINDRQPARLADGEFVIPADVVSGIGNGSSKAGAKRLYSMMDRVRKERTGTTKQAKAINPAKVMAA